MTGDGSPEPSPNGKNERTGDSRARRPTETAGISAPRSPSHIAKSSYGDRRPGCRTVRHGKTDRSCAGLASHPQYLLSAVRPIKNGKRTRREPDSFHVVQHYLRVSTETPVETDMY
jgi:hypothetical protein